MADVVRVSSRAGATSPPDGVLLDAALDTCLRPPHDQWSYLGGESPAPDDWSPQPQLGLTVIGPRSGDAARGAVWAACVLVDSTAEFLVPLQGIVDRAGGIPAELATCFPGESTDILEAPPGSCSRPHVSELIGGISVSRLLVTNGETAPPMSRQELTASCRDLVVAATHRPTILTGPALSVRMAIYDGSRLPAVEVTGEISTDTEGWATCVITAVDGRRLVGSLRLIGDGPIPWES